MGKWKFGGSKRAWYIRRSITYSFGRNIQNKVQSEFYCPFQKKWLPSYQDAAPASKGAAHKVAFMLAVKALDEPGEFRVVCRVMPMKWRIRVSGESRGKWNMSEQSV